MEADPAKIPVWLDCDPGHDDAFAILLAAHHPAIELLGISTVHGNSSVEHTTENAGSVLTAIGRSEIPVYAGAAAGIVRPAVHATDIHGESGLEGTSLLPRPLVPAIRTIPAVDAIAAALLATERDTAWLIATGALTNIAQLFTKYPELARHLKGISVMGGAVGDSFTAAPLGKVNTSERFGNWTPYAEFNIVCDPEAAHIVFSNPGLAAKATMIPLDVTHQVLATKDVQKLLLQGKGSPKLTEESLPTRRPSVLRTMLVELLNFFAHTYATVFGITAGPPLHDPLAVAVILNGIPEYDIPFYDHEEGQEGRQERYHVSIVTEGTHEEAVRGEAQTGRTVVTLHEKGKPGVRIPRGLDVQRFWEVLEECLERADDKVRGDGILAASGGPTT